MKYVYKAIKKKKKEKSNCLFGQVLPDNEII